MSNNAVSYKELHERLKIFADGHDLIRKFYAGPLTDADVEKDGEYPFMHVQHPEVSYPENGIQYNLSVTFADMARDFDDKSQNQVNVLSSCMALAGDLMNEIMNGNFIFPSDALIVGTPTVTPGVYDTKHGLATATLNIVVEMDNDWSACDIPADWVPIGSSGDGGSQKSNCCPVEFTVSKNFQPGNNFVVGTPIYVSGDNQFSAARADDVSQSYVTGIVTTAGDAFLYKMNGIIQGAEGVPNYPAGTRVFLAPGGGLTDVEPTAPNVVRPLMIVLEPGVRAILLLSLQNMGTGGGGGGGTVTSVDVSADGNAITPDGGPITSAGTINLEFNGASTDYIDGEGNLQTFPTIPGPAPVDSVNGQTGVVVLGASDVGADPAGSAAAALNAAQLHRHGVARLRAERDGPRYGQQRPAESRCSDRRRWGDDNGNGN
jgi:hypothetical protein